MNILCSFLFYIENEWKSLFQLLGSLFEITGAFLMANIYLRVYKYQKILAIISALWRGEKAEESTTIAGIVPERRLSSLQGLSFIGLGFLLQAIPNVAEVLSPILLE
jgi:hypothetical protein